MHTSLVKDTIYKHSIVLVRGGRVKIYQELDITSFVVHLIRQGSRRERKEDLSMVLNLKNKSNLKVILVGHDLSWLYEYVFY
jgi:hypothetical protein